VENDMKRNFLILFLALAVTAVFAEPNVVVLRKSGECKLKISNNPWGASDSEIFSVSLTNSDVAVTCDLWSGDWAKNFRLFGKIKSDSKTDNDLSIGYNVAFFDKSGEFIACLHLDGSVNGNAQGVGSEQLMSIISPEEFAKIDSYKIVLQITKIEKK
jgi:hypothetical protein